MTKKKYYAVVRGKTEGIFETWNECKNCVEGVKGALYKSFASHEEAVAFLNGTDLDEKHLQQAASSDTVIAYVDGSYDDTLKKYSFGCVIITPQGEIIEAKDCNDDPQALSSRNVAGELQGAMFAMKWVSEKGFTKVLIRHDYEGISKWVTREWKAKAYSAVKYIEYMDKYKGKIDVSFEKVVAHSGDKYNEIADKLARSAIKSKVKLNSGDTHFTVEGIELVEIQVIVDIINDAIEALIVVKTNDSKKTSFIITKGAEKIYIICYNSKKTVIQGKPLILFNMFISYITELLDVDAITPTLNQLYNISIEKNQIDIQTLEYLPDLTSFHSEKMEASLHQAIYNLNLCGKMYDYTFLVHPALRALEGHIRYLMIKHNVPIKDKFDMFEPHPNGGHRLKEEYKSNFGSPAKISYITKSYAFFRRYRHNMFHWDTPIGIVDTTVMVNSKADADTITKDTLKLINEYFITK